MVLFMEWKPKRYLNLRNRSMNKFSVSLLEDNFKQCFTFLGDYDYVLSYCEMITENQLKLVFINKIKEKEILISICISEYTKNFYIYIAIVRIPYLVDFDFVDFDIYLDKNKIKHPNLLEEDEQNNENANKYIETYAELFKEYGIELIISDKQFPHYFPERT